MAGITVPDKIYVPKDEGAVVTFQGSAQACLPLWGWLTGGTYNPYLIQPIKLGDTADRILTFKVVSVASGKVIDKTYEIVLNDADGSHVVSDLPATVEDWVRRKKPADMFCVILLSREVANAKQIPKEAELRQPDDKWPRGAAQGPDKILANLLLKVIKMKDKKLILKPAELELLRMTAERLGLL